MTTPTNLGRSADIEYPDSDGKPMSDNTLQFRNIVMIEGGLDALFRDDPNVFVAGDLLWYPVEGNNKIRAAPDALVAFGRPKGDRGSYMQWREGGIAPQVVFEVLSPGNRFGEMLRKYQFYERYGVEEYYIWDPDDAELEGYQRTEGRFQDIPDMNGWVSPRLKVRFEVADGELKLYGPDGRPFAAYVELVQQRDEAQRERELAQREREQAQREREQAQREREQAQQEREQARQRAELLAEKLRTLGVDPDAA